MTTIQARRGDEREGVLLIDKPKGWTSHDVVMQVRRKFKMKRVGHAGTLDPMATGLLFILVGRATKVSAYLMSMEKGYDGTLCLGVSTDSYDAEGCVTMTRPVPSFDVDFLKGHMQSFLGDQYQVPPMFSAKKVDGTPLYKLARKGKSIEREPRFIHVKKFDFKGYEAPNLSFSVTCSKGTYIRSIAHDLGEKLGCGGHLIQLTRTSIGEQSLDAALSWDAFQEMQADKISLIHPRDLIPAGLMD